MIRWGRLSKKMVCCKWTTHLVYSPHKIIIASFLHSWAAWSASMLSALSLRSLQPTPSRHNQEQAPVNKRLAWRLTKTAQWVLRHSLEAAYIAKFWRTKAFSVTWDVDVVRPAKGDSIIQFTARLSSVAVPLFDVDLVHPWDHFVSNGQTVWLWQAQLWESVSSSRPSWVTAASNSPTTVKLSVQNVTSLL